jgi:hypothetical protein
MQHTRSVTYASVTGTEGARTIFSSARTWGELKAEDVDIAAKSMGMKAWIKTTPNDNGRSVSSDGDHLPEGDFNIYFLVSKNDSGHFHR